MDNIDNIFTTDITYTVNTKGFIDSWDDTTKTVMTTGAILTSDNIDTPYATHTIVTS